MVDQPATVPVRLVPKQRATAFPHDDLYCIDSTTNFAKTAAIPLTLRPPSRRARSAQNRDLKIDVMPGGGGAEIVVVIEGMLFPPCLTQGCSLVRQLMFLTTYKDH